MLRTARALIEARIPAKRIRRSLESLRRELPESVPLSGLAISAVGEHVVVRDGESRCQADGGQYLLGLDVSLENGVLHVVERREEVPAGAPRPVARLVRRGAAHSRPDPQAALAAYATRRRRRRPSTSRPGPTGGGCCTRPGAPRKRRRGLRRALGQRGPRSLLLFNQGVLLEDLGDAGAALQAYQTALEEDPDFADCHYNLARLYESAGKPQHAIRHLGQYRRLVARREPLRAGGAHAHLGRNFRIQLSRVEGQLLSGEDAGRQDAAVLRRAFATVEINYTFYRVPNAKILAGWAAETPAGFRLTLKAPKRITHIAKLQRLRGPAAVLS